MNRGKEGILREKGERPAIEEILQRIESASKL